MYIFPIFVLVALSVIAKSWLVFIIGAIALVIDWIIKVNQKNKVINKTP